MSSAEEAPPRPPAAIAELERKFSESVIKELRGAARRARTPSSAWALASLVARRVAELKVACDKAFGTPERRAASFAEVRDRVLERHVFGSPGVPEAAKAILRGVTEHVLPSFGGMLGGVLAEMDRDGDRRVSREEFGAYGESKFSSLCMPSGCCAEQGGCCHPCCSRVRSGLGRLLRSCIFPCVSCCDPQGVRVDDGGGGKKAVGS